MPRRAKPARLYLHPQERQWIIRDGPRFIRTGASEGQRDSAEKALHEYTGLKHTPEPSPAPLIADVLTVFTDEVAPHRKTARNAAYQVGSLLKWWGTKTVADITTKSCRAYTAARTPMAAQADLKILKAAVDYWHREKHPLNVLPTFWRPKNNPPKDRWLTKSEAARLLNAARHCLHLRRQILLQLYTGSRPGVVLALQWDQIDLTAGVMHRIPRGARQDAKKRSPPVRPAHCRTPTALETARRCIGEIRLPLRRQGDQRPAQFVGPRGQGRWSRWCHPAHPAAHPSDVAHASRH
jgi:integrase